MDNKTGRKLRDLRLGEDKSQRQLSMDTFLSQESITKYENGERKVKPSLTNHYIKNHNDPALGLHAVSEYLGWHVDPLDGPAVDMHRSSVHMKAIEEMREALNAMENCNILNNPDYVAAYERQNIKKAASEVMDGIHALILYLMTLCKDFGFKWDEIWDEHQRKLQSRGYVKA